MSTRKPMTDLEILDAYEEWPEQRSIDDFAAHCGRSRGNIYQILRRHNVTPKSRRPDHDPMTEALDAIDKRLSRIEEQLRQLTLHVAPGVVLDRQEVV